VRVCGVHICGVLAVPALVLALAGGGVAATVPAPPGVVVGPGYVDASDRAVVRTQGGRVYVFAADDTAERTSSGPGVIHAYRADQTGVPTSFTEVDGTHRPSATGSTHVLGAPDVRLDRSGLVHLVYIDQTNRNVVYRTFSTATDAWGSAETLGTNGAPISSSILREGNAALVLGADDVPRVVYSTGSSLVYRSRVGGAWSSPATLATTGSPIHPQLAADAAGTLYLAWLQDGASPSIHYRSLPASGTWGPDETVAGSDVLSNSNSDQGPSIVVTASGVPTVLFVSASRTVVGSANYGTVRIRSRSGGTWTENTVPSLLSHTPQIYAQNDDLYAFLGHDTNIHFGYAWQPAGGSWSPYTVLYSSSTVDGSASIRWDPQRETNANVVDVAFYDEDVNDDKSYRPRVYYVGVPSQGTHPDTTPPSVSLTAPADGALLAGSVTLTANASDDVGVASVQFLVDGQPLPTDTTAPYAAAWNTRTAADGRHTLVAVARDAAGNSATTSTVTISVDNTPPTVAFTAPAASSTVNGAVTVTAGAADANGIASVQFTLDGVALGAPDTTAPYSVAWDTSTVADGTHTLGASATDSAANTSTASETVTVHNAPPPPAGDTTPPSVSLTAPANGALLAGTVTVTASATDDVGVASVEFLLDGQPGATVTTAPYGVTWDTSNVDDGTHVLTAVATDGSGNTSRSSAITVTVDNTPPTVALTTPTSPSVKGVVTVGASAGDASGVTEVDFSLDGVPLGPPDTTAPYSVTWDSRSVADGPHTLAATARDAAGNWSGTARFDVVVFNTPLPTPPSVTNFPPPPFGGGGGGGGSIPPDLHVDLSTDTTTAPPVGSELVYRIRVFSANLGSASAVRLDLSFGPGLAVERTYADRGSGCGAAAATMSCDVAWVTSLTASTVTVWATVTGAGPLHATANVASLVETEPATMLADDTTTLELPAAPAAPAPVDLPPPHVLQPPSVPQSAKAGSTIHARPPKWSTAPTRVTYRWQLCTTSRCTAIGGATSLSLKVRSAYAHRTVRLVTTATVGGSAITSYSRRIAVRS
jgi:Big-like domain-containing protein